MPHSLYINGFKDIDLNGVYVSYYLYNGFPYYSNTNNKAILYYEKNMQYSLETGYYLSRIYSFNDSVPIFRPKYVNFSNNPLTGTWVSLMDTISGEYDITIDWDVMSSSSSKSSNSSSSSSDSSSSDSSNSSLSSSSNSSSSNSSESSQSSLSSSSDSSSNSSVSSLSSGSSQSVVVDPWDEWMALSDTYGWNLTRGSDVIDINEIYKPNSLPSQLPDSVLYFGCSSFLGETLPASNFVQTVVCTDSPNVTSLPNWSSAITIYCSYCGVYAGMSSLPAWPNVVTVECNGTNITSIPYWPLARYILCTSNYYLDCQTGVYPNLPTVVSGEINVSGCLNVTPTTIATNKGWTVYT